MNASNTRRRYRSALQTIARAPVVAVLALVVVVPVAGSAPDASWPLMRSPLNDPISVATPFDPPAQPWLPGHRGVDLAGSHLGPVHAPTAGTVRFAGPVAGTKVISIDHGGGLRTTYQPVEAAVRAGDDVPAGHFIGHLLTGHPGCPVEACLHWGARVGSGEPPGDDDEYIDPMSLLDPADRPIRLKPALPGDGEA